MINWSDPSYVANHNFSALIHAIKISCYNETTGSQSYVYSKGLTPTTPIVSLSNQSTILSGANSMLGNVGRQLRRALVVIRDPTPDAPILSLSNQSTVLNAGQLQHALAVVVGLILISCIL